MADVWNRVRAGAIPRTVPGRIGLGEETLRGLYADAERQRVLLVEGLRKEAAR